MKNMSWQQFLTEFVLRAMARPDIHHYNFPARYAADLAREAWEAIQAAELPESEKAKQSVIVANPPDLKPSNSTELKALARTARNVVAEEAQYIAIDADGEVWAYDLKPTIDEFRNAWDSARPGGHWEIGSIAPPADFTKELYQISKILNNE